jgi:hypothetical protein
MGKVSLDKKRDIVSKTSKELKDISSTKKTTSTKRIKRQPLSNSKSSIRRDTAKILSF